jgi:propionyl-CoA synthetase
VLDASRPPLDRWFSGCEVNSCYKALDLHVERGRDEQTALIYDSPVTGTIKSSTYRELLDDMARFAGVIVGQGVRNCARLEQRKISNSALTCAARSS